MSYKERELLAYIEVKKGIVLVDVVKLTRNGRSYYFQERRWLRNQHPLGCELCTAASGCQMRIAILSRNYVPKWVSSATLQVSSKAKERFDYWTQSFS